MNDKPQGFLARAVDFYLNNRYVLAVSSFVCCSLIGFSMGLITGSLFSDAAQTQLLSGFLGGLAFGALGATSSLKHRASGRVTRAPRDPIMAFSSFMGGALIFCAAATVLGISGTANLVIAIGASLLTSLWLAVQPHR